MARIAGINLPNEKKIKISLTYIFGIGRASAVDIAVKAGVDPEKKTGELSDKEVADIQTTVKEYVVEGDLRRSVRNDIQRLRSTGTYRGLRHRRGLPVRGQRSRTNARTRKGRRRSPGGRK